MQYFSKDDVNKGRQPEIDCLKAFCIVFMVLLHAYEELAMEPGGPYYVIRVIEIMSGAAAFMFCMGIGTRYSRSQSPRDFLVRGFEILTIGQLLNLLRDSIPDLIVWWTKGIRICLSCALLVVQTDILTFAGLAFVFLALLRYLKLSGRTILIISMIMNVACFGLSFVFRSTGNYLLDMVLGFFVVTSAESYFPLCTYFLFVAMGYYLGGLYRHISDKDSLSAKVLTICLPIVIVYYTLRFFVPFPVLPEFLSNEQYILNPLPDALANCLSAISLLALFYRILKHRNGQVPAAVSFISKHINQYYCISYVFFTPTATFMYALKGELMPGTMLPLLSGISVFAVTTVIIHLNNRFFHLGFAGLKNPVQRRAVYSVIWILTILIIIYVYPQITEYANIWNDYLI